MTAIKLTESTGYTVKTNDFTQQAQIRLFSTQLVTVAP